MSEEFPIVIVSIIKRHDDDICRKTADQPRPLFPSAFVIVAPFDLIRGRIHDMVGGNSTIRVSADEDNDLITVLCTNAYYALYPTRDHDFEASRLFTALRDLVKRYCGSYEQMEMAG